MRLVAVAPVDGAEQSRAEQSSGWSEQGQGTERGTRMADGGWRMVEAHLLPEFGHVSASKLLDTAALLEAR